MNAGSLIDYLRARGAHLEAKGGRLLVDAPPGLLTPELKGELATRKAELLAILSFPSRGGSERLTGGPYAGFLMSAGDLSPDPGRAREALEEAELWRQKRLAWLRDVLRVEPREEE